MWWFELKTSFDLHADTNTTASSPGKEEEEEEQEEEEESGFLSIEL